MSETHETPLAVVDRQVEAYNEGDIDQFVSEFASDAEVSPLGADGETTLTGREEIREQYGAMFAAHPSLQCEVVSEIVLGNTVVLHERVSISGEETDQALGIYRVEDGLITRLWLAHE